MTKEELKDVIRKARNEAESDSRNIADTPALICSRIFDYIYRALREDKNSSKK